MVLEENFHVCIIISKLPSSWKDFHTNMMRKKEDIPLEKLLHCIQVEEKSNEKDKKEELVKKAHVAKMKFKKKLFSPKKKKKQYERLSTSTRKTLLHLWQTWTYGTSMSFQEKQARQEYQKKERRQR